MRSFLHSLFENLNTHFECNPYLGVVKDQWRSGNGVPCLGNHSIDVWSWIVSYGVRLFSGQPSSVGGTLSGGCGLPDGLNLWRSFILRFDNLTVRFGATTVNC